MAITFLAHKPNGYKIVVDHKNNIKTDDILENLQLIIHRENISKDQKNKTSQYVGVYWHKQIKRWIAQIQINNKRKYLGSFTDESEAAAEYQKALTKII